MKTRNPVDYDDVFAEKSAWVIYWKAQRIRLSLPNAIILIVCEVLLIIYAFGFASTEAVVEQGRRLIEFWFPIGLGTLGLLVSGFAIYIALMKRTLFIKLTQVTSVESGLPLSKHVMFIFMDVLIFYVIFAIYCLMIHMFGMEGGLISEIMHYFGIAGYGAHLLASVFYVITGLGVIWSVLELHVFIYNIYSSSVACLIWEENENADGVNHEKLTAEELKFVRMIRKASVRDES